MANTRTLLGWVILLVMQLILAAMWSVSVGESFGTVITGMVGVMIFMIFSLAMILLSVEKQVSYGIAALVATLLFVVLWRVMPELTGMQGLVLALVTLVVNIIVCIVIGALLPREGEPREEEVIETHDHHHTVEHQHTEHHHHYHQQQAEYYKKSAEYYAQQAQQYQAHAQMKEKYQEAAEAHAQKSAEYQKQLHDLKDKLHATQSELTISKKNVSKTLRSIEDKCKALNFAIGRVYADKKGGSSELRAKLMIHRDWYNTFSEITAEYSPEDAKHLLSVLEKIHGQLLQMEQKEKDVFEPIKDAQIPAERKTGGRDIILDVLIGNDKDPVADFHADAKDVCEKLIDYLRGH